MPHPLSFGRRLLVVALTAVALASLSACELPPIDPIGSTPFPLPRSGAALAAGTLVFDSDRSGHWEIYTRTPAGVTKQITSSTTHDSWWARLSPDRRTIVYQRVPKGVHDRDYDQVEIWAVAANGGTPVRVRSKGQDGWVHQGHVEWAPDGSQLVLFGGTRYDTQIFLIDPDGTNPTQVTDRSGTNVDPAFLPDGLHIAFVGCPTATCYSEDFEIYTIPIGGGMATRLTTNALIDHDPYVSPDGTRIAWITETAKGTANTLAEWDVFVANVDGTNARRLFNDGGNAGAPVWSGSSTLLVHRFPAGHTAFQLYKVGVDTGVVTNLTGMPAYSNEYPSP